MVARIGEVAGKVWHFLEENEESSLARLKRGLKDKVESTEEVLMGIGWLAKEGKIEFKVKGVKKGKRYSFALKK